MNNSPTRGTAINPARARSTDIRLGQADSTKKLRAFLIGTGIEKSISPAIHNTLFGKLGLNAEYSLLDLEGSELESKVGELRTAGDVLGFNVTAPFKERVMKFLSSVDEHCQPIGAVNTVKVSADGELSGYNTDVFGIDISVERLGCFSDGESSRRNKGAVILGAGGAARACMFVLLSRGFEQITVFNRSKERALNVVENFKSRFREARLEAAKLDQVDLLEERLRTSELVINAISDQWMSGGKFPISIDFGTIRRNGNNRLRVLDLGYKHDSPLLEGAKSAGIDSMDGLLMLAGQASKSFEIWTGITPKIEEVMSLAKRAVETIRGC